MRQLGFSALIVLATLLFSFHGAPVSAHDAVASLSEDAVASLSEDDETAHSHDQLLSEIAEILERNGSNVIIMDGREVGRAASDYISGSGQQAGKQVVFV